MSKATPEALEALHGALTKAFTEYLAKVNSGEAEISASVLKELRAFINDNGIQQVPKADNGMGALLREAGKLPFPGESTRPN